MQNIHHVGFSLSAMFAFLKDILQVSIGHTVVVFLEGFLLAIGEDPKVEKNLLNQIYHRIKNPNEHILFAPLMYPPATTFPPWAKATHHPVPDHTKHYKIINQ